jgi:hypothetical protein
MISRGRLVVVLLLPALALGLVGPAAGCPFCLQDLGPTLVGHFDDSDMVLVGRFTNARLGPGGLDEGTTDFIIETALKTNEAIKGKKMITLPRYIPQAKAKFMIFCEISKSGRIEAYRGDELQSDGDMVKYLMGAVAVKSKSSEQRLRYFFNYLNDPDLVVSRDAYREFAKADYKEYKEMARKLDPEVIVRWLEDPKTLNSRYGLFASFLGHCGKPEHAKVLRKMIDEAEKNKFSGVDGLLAGYVMLQPKEGWERLKDIMKSSKDFNFRFAALRTCRFLYAERTDLLEAKDIAEGLTLLLANSDIADFAIDTLRKWKRWDMTDRVLDLYGKESLDVGTVHRSIVKFALRAPQPRAKKFVEDQRRADSEWVNEIEELLNLEDPTGAVKQKSDKSPAPRSESSMLYWGAGILVALAVAAVPGRRLLLKGR